MTRRLALAALLLTASPAAAELDMLLPVAVEHHPHGWRLLHYAPEPFAAHEARLLMFCLRAAEPLASAPMVHVVPDGDTPRRDKLHVLVTEAGAAAIASGELPAYVTRRVQNMGEEAGWYTFRIWIRRGE